MNILITGGFGNIGLLVVEECLKRGHTITVFDIPTKRNNGLFRKYRKKNVNVHLKSIVDYEDIAKAVIDQDVVIHMAAILPPSSDENPELCRAVNVLGTENLVKAIQQSQNQPAIIEISSASVMGRTQDREPPVRANDSLLPTDVYSTTKIEAEAIIVASQLRYCILRLAAVIPTGKSSSGDTSMAKLIFDMPLNARCEIVFDRDVAFALVSAAEKMHQGNELLGVKGFIGGGAEKGCQITVRELVKGMFEPIGLLVPKDQLFKSDINAYYLDWYDTTQTQSALHYQRTSIKDWPTFIKKQYGIFWPFVRLFKHQILKWLEKQSPKSVT